MVFRKLLNLIRGRRTSDVHRFRALFERFQQVLSGNNRSLELIAQLEDKLSGDYIFDIHYLEHVTTQLSEEIYRVIYNLNLLSGNRYTGLFSRHEAIQADLEDVLEGGGEAPDGRDIVPYDRASSDLTDLVGAKNALLAEVRNHLELPTPDGFAVTTSAYRKFLEYNDLWPQIQKVYEVSKRAPEGAGRRHDVEIAELFSRVTMPPDLERSITRGVAEMRKKHGAAVMGFAVRSSAAGEDEEGSSFAGQFRSVLNASDDAVVPAYIEVLASRFGYRSMMYDEKLAADAENVPMAVAVQQMIPALAAGVVYTVDPSGEHVDRLVITAGFGLGVEVVAGTAHADYYQVSRLHPDRIIERRIGNKEKQVVGEAGGGTKRVDVREKARREPCLTEIQVYELTEIALLLDRCFKRPLDIEWCLDEEGTFTILQLRPLRIQKKRTRPAADLETILHDRPRILDGKGEVAQRGIAAGRVKLVKEDDDLESFPVGAIAITDYTTPRLTSIIRRAAAIVTDAGSTMGHMATVAREFGVPLIVNTGDATRLLNDGDEITVDAEENVVYRGVVRELLEYDMGSDDVFRDLREYRILRQLLRKVTPLYLVDPKSTQFTAKNCRTYHDLLRFSHEKAVQELIDLNISSRPFRGIRARKMKLPVPLDLYLIDLGGGLGSESDDGAVDDIDRVRSVPMRAILEGLTGPGVWSTDPVNLGFGDFISSLTRHSMTDRGGEYTGQNLAVLSKHYANISLRLGYHFNVIDTYVSESVSDNYIYFRFVGGVTETDKRRLRALLIRKILERLSFWVTVDGDLVVGNLKQREKKETLDVLEDIGRLIGFTRQLDTQMQSTVSVDEYLQVFFQDNRNSH